MKQAPKENSF